MFNNDKYVKESNKIFSIKTAEKLDVLNPYLHSKILNNILLLLLLIKYLLVFFSIFLVITCKSISENLLD